MEVQNTTTQHPQKSQQTILIFTFKPPQNAQKRGTEAEASKLNSSNGPESASGGIGTCGTRLSHWECEGGWYSKEKGPRLKETGLKTSIPRHKSSEDLSYCSGTKPWRSMQLGGWEGGLFLRDAKQKEPEMLKRQHGYAEEGLA